jgi:hypothetical protein
LVTQKIIQFHDALLRELTSDNGQFLQTTVARFFETARFAPGAPGEASLPP